MSKKKGFVWKISSLGMSALMVGSAVPSIVFAMSDKNVIQTNDAAKQKNEQGISFENPVMVLFNDLGDPYVAEGSDRLDVFVKYALIYMGVELPTNDYRMDWVDTDGVRHALRMGTNAKKGSVQTLDDFMNLARKQKDGFTLVLFDNDKELARMTIGVKDDMYLKVDEVKELPKSYRISYDANGGDFVQNENEVRAEGEQISYLNGQAVRSGYRFDGWYTEAEGGEKVDLSKKMDSDMTVYAHWKEDKNVAIVSFDTQGGDVVLSVEAEIGKEITDLPYAQRTGYEFLGWFKGSEANAEKVDTLVPDGDITLYAHWKEIPVEKVTVTFDAQNGTDVESVELDKDTGLIELPTPVRDGYQFVGWFTEKEKGEQVNVGHKVTDNVTFYAHWKKNEESSKEEITLTFETNGGEKIEPQVIHKGEAVGTLPVAKKVGFTFDGWYLDKELTQKVTEKTTFSGNTVLYAKWVEGETPVEKVTVKFDSKGGTEVKSLELEKGSKLGQLPQPERKGYKFLGWFTEEENGDKVDSDKVIDANVTLYAHWEKLPDNHGNETEKPNKPEQPEQPNKPEKPNDSNSNANGNAEQQKERYSLMIIQPDGNSSTKVEVNSDVTLNALCEKLGLKAVSFKIRTAGTQESDLSGDKTMKEVLSYARDKEALIIGYDAENKPLGSAKITNKGEGSYVVQLSKSTDVALKGPDGTEDKNKGKGEGVSNEGKENAVANSVKTADAMPIYAGMTGLTAALGTVIAIVKKKFL